jgi:hypothetical protein
MLKEDLYKTIPSNNFTPLAKQLLDLAEEKRIKQYHTFLGVCHIKEALEEILQKHPGITNY